MDINNLYDNCIDFNTVQHSNYICSKAFLSSQFAYKLQSLKVCKFCGLPAVSAIRSCGDTRQSSPGLQLGQPGSSWLPIITPSKKTTEQLSELQLSSIFNTSPCRNNTVSNLSRPEGRRFKLGNLTIEDDTIQPVFMSAIWFSKFLNRSFVWFKSFPMSFSHSRLVRS